MLFIILCVVFVPFGFPSIETTCLPREEVETLRVIGKALVYDFKEDPCSTVVPVVNKTYAVDTVSEHKVSDDTVSCSREPNATICNVLAVSLKGQNLQGTLPKEFANLLYLQNIDLTYNFLNGTIPPEWGSMKLVRTICLIGNRITGSIPKEVGNISTLTYLTVEDNLMYGAIPEELGNLASMEVLFLNSNYFTGELPASFGNLTNMKQFRIGSNNFSGKIPDYIGKWKNLTKLRIQASGLEGPIPSTITLLTNLSDLRISDLKGPDTLCPPFSNKTSFKYLILRSCNLIGQLPRSLAPGSLNLVDLSFNKLNGSIPEEFIALKNAHYIYLTGNLLDGIVPKWMLEEKRNRSM